MYQMSITTYLKSKPFLGYFVAAGSGVIVQYIIGSMLCIRYLGLPRQQSILIGFLCAIPVGFILSKNIAFSSRRSGRSIREILKYIVPLSISGLITVFGDTFSLRVLQTLFGEGLVTLPVIGYSFNLIGTISHFAGMGFSFVFNFFTHKYFTFAETGLFEKIFKSK
jgi:putative flippase GtrA